MIAQGTLRAIAHAPYLRAISALLAATLAVLIHSISRFSDYRALLHVPPVVGYVKFSGAGQYNTRQEGEYVIP